MVADVKGRIENLSVEQAATEIEEGSVTLVDIREDDERTQNGAIPNSVRAPRGMLEFWADPSSPYHRQEFDPDRRHILYCAAGGRSALAADTLQRMSYENVCHVDGGLRHGRNRDTQRKKRLRASSGKFACRIRHKAGPACRVPSAVQTIRVSLLAKLPDRRNGLTPAQIILQRRLRARERHLRPR